MAVILMISDINVVLLPWDVHAESSDAANIFFRVKHCSTMVSDTLVTYS